MNIPNKFQLRTLRRLALLAASAASVVLGSSSAFASAPVNNITNVIVIYQENWPFDGLYGSFPGANGIANASTSSTTQVDRLSGNAVSTIGSTFNNAALTGLTSSAAMQNPPLPLAADSNGSLVDPNFANAGNTLIPYSLSQFINPTVLTGDIYHRYWQEQYQIAGTVTNPNGTDSAAGNQSGFVTWSDNPGLVMSHFDATNLPEGLLAQQYTICDNFFHSAFGGSFLNHQFLIAAAPPVYDNMPGYVNSTNTGNSANIAYLDANGAFIMNTAGSSVGKYARDGSITPVAGDQISVAVSGNPASVVTLTAANCQPYAAAAGSVFGAHYVVNTTRSVNLSNGTESNALVSLMPSLDDSAPGASGRTYEQNIGDLLSQANVSWKWYSGGWAQIAGYSTANNGSNPLYPKITDGMYTAMNNQNQYQYHHQPFAYFDNTAPFGSTMVPAAYVGGFAGVLPSQVSAGQTGATLGSIPAAVNSAAHIQDETNFFTDVSNGTLPSVCFIKPVGINNEHPGYAAVQTGQNHVASIVQAVQANPTLWAHTMIIITYDEHGGRWDHVTPPNAGTSSIGADIWGPGQRVPCIVISPYAKRGFVDHSQYTTSSILSMIEQRYGLPNLNARDTAAPALTAMLTNLQITQAPFVLNSRSKRMTQVVTVTNLDSAAATGPVQLVLGNLSSGTTLTNASGTTVTTSPVGSPYVTVSAGDLAAGASASFTLQFTIPSSGGITYSPSTVTGTPAP